VPAVVVTNNDCRDQDAAKTTQVQHISFSHLDAVWYVFHLSEGTVLNLLTVHNSDMLYGCPVVCTSPRADFQQIHSPAERQDFEGLLGQTVDIALCNKNN
jgi:hypothetical protein